MCDIYVKADPLLYESRSRSLRIHGCVSNIRLENHFWDTLSELAGGEGMTTNQLITKLYDEIIAYRGQVDNFSSFLRVTCLRYLRLRHPASEGRDEMPAVGAFAPLAMPRVGFYPSKTSTA